MWFDDQAEEAANFYGKIFKNSKIIRKVNDPEGKLQTVVFELDGQEFIAINAGPRFKFTEAISFVVNCKDQAEVDHYWKELTADGGEESMCGWLQDKYGLFWQVIPTRLEELLASSDPAVAARAGDAMLKMRKIVIAELEEAVKG